MFAKTIVARLAAGAADGASGATKRDAIEALRSVGSGFGSNEGAMLHAAFVQGVFKGTDFDSPFALHDALPTQRVPPPDRSRHPNAADTCGFSKPVFEALQQQPIDIIDSDGEFGFGQQSSVTARMCRERLLTIGRTLGALRRLLQFGEKGQCSVCFFAIEFSLIKPN